MSQTILSVSDAKDNDFDYTLTYGNMIYKNKEIQNVRIEDIVGSFTFEEKLSLDNALKVLYNHNDSYGERNINKLNNDIYTNLNNIKNTVDAIDLIQIGDKYYVGQDGNHRVFYLINEYNKLKNQFKDDVDKLAEINKMFELKCRVTKKSEFELINKICYALNKCWIDDFKIDNFLDKEQICQVKYNGNIYPIKSEEEFLNFFRSYYNGLEKKSDKFNKLTLALSNVGINMSEFIIKHPKSKELNELEKQKQIAQQNNDEVAYNYFQQCIIKTIKENRMQVSLEQWTSFSKEQKESYIQIKMREAKTLNDKDEFNYWLAVLNNLKQQDLGNSNNKIHLNTVSKTSLEGLKNSVGSTEGYTVLVHGTHLTDMEVEKMIFKEGLRATGKNEESSLVHTTQPLDIGTYSLEELKSKMDNYGHNNRNMVIIKLPNEYFNMYADHGDRNCTRSRAFMKKIQVDGGYKYVLEPKFIVGSYNTETMEATLNNSFERELTDETRIQLKNNLDNLQKELGIDPDYIEAINSEEIIDVNQPLYNSMPINNEFKDEHKKPIQNNVTNKDYNYYFDEMVKLTQKYNSSEQMKEEQRKQLISEIFYNESYLVESLTNDEGIRQIMNRSVNELDNNEIQIKLQNVILNEIQEKYKQLHPVQQTKEENVSNNDHNNKESNLSGLISQLKTKLNRIQNSYHSMLSDGYIDDKELATLLALINKVIGEGYSLKSLATDSNDLKVISVIIDSLEKEQAKMNKIQNGIEEMGKTMQ